MIVTLERVFTVDQDYYRAEIYRNYKDREGLKDRIAIFESTKISDIRGALKSFVLPVNPYKIKIKDYYPEKEYVSTQQIETLNEIYSSHLQYIAIGPSGDVIESLT